MSDEKDNKSPASFELDWDDALSDWERDVDSSAEARSNPMPQKAAPKPATPPSRALYQPPDPAEIARLRQQSASAKHVSLADDDGEEHTVMAHVPSIPKRPTAPAPATTDRATQRPASPELDLDDLLANLDDETRMYPGEAVKAPAVVSAPVRPPPPKAPPLPRPPAPPAGPPRPRSPLLKPAAGGAAGGPVAPPARPPLPPRPGVAPARPVVPHPPVADAARDSLADDISAFEESLRPPPPAPADDDVFIVPDDDLAVSAAATPVPPPPAPDTSAMPTPIPPPKAQDPSSVPTPVPPPPERSALDDELDAALASIDVAAPVADAEPPSPEQPAATPAPIPSAPPADLGALLFGDETSEPAAPTLAAAAPTPPPQLDQGVDDLLDDLAGALASPAATAALAAEGPGAAAPAAPPTAPTSQASSSAGTSSAPATTAPAKATAQADRGAQTARRTVRSRKPRREVFPLVGRQPQALVARAELLEGAAPGLAAPQRARALLAAAELRLQLGEIDVVQELSARAAEADPSSIAAARLSRATAATRGDVAGVATWLEREAALHEAPAEKSSLFSAAADAWARAGDAEKARGAARAAYEARPGLLSALVALAHASEDAASASAFAVLREASAGKLVRGIAAHAAVRAVASRGELPDAESASVPGVAIAALASPSLAPAARAQVLDGLLGSLDGELAEAARVVSVRESAATPPTDGEGESVDETARRLGAESSRPAALAVALEAAIARGSSDEGAFSERLAAHLEGGERAALLARASMLLSSAGDLADAEALLRAATMADASLGGVTAARARLDELDPARRAQQVESEGALAVAARLARDPASAPDEAQLLERALERTDAPPTADVLALDVAAALAGEPRGRAALQLALRRSARKSGADAPERSVGALLAGALAGDGAAAAESYAAHPSAVTARAMVLVAESPADSAKAWSAEAAASAGPTGASSGHAAVRAAREAARALAAFEPHAAGEKLAAAGPDDLVAAALAAVLAERGGDPGARAQALERYASLESDPSARARDLIRAALCSLQASDGGSTRRLLARASAEAPEDPILNLMRWRDATGNAVDVAPEVAERRPSGASGQPAAVLAAHTALVVGASPPDGLELTGVASAARDEARRRAEQVEASRRLVAAPESVEAAGADLGALRALERARMLDLTGLDDVELAIAGALEDAQDRAPYLRLAYTAGLRAPAQPDREERWLELARDTDADPWLARRIASAASRHGDAASATKWGLRVAESLGTPLERASAAMHATAGARAAGDARELVEVLRAFQVAAPQHPLLGERIAELAVLAGETTEAASSLEAAARAAVDPRRKARLFVAAADLLDESGDDPARIVAALEEASKADVTYGEVFERLRTTLERSGDKERLSALVARRLAAGGEGAAAVELFLAQASLREAAGDVEGTRQALRSALEHSPDHLGALKKLAQLSLAEEDYRGAAEALIRLAKLRREVDELRWIFFELAGIYDRHIPDAKRAEAAYKRVLKLVPDDTGAMERLADLYRREGMLPQAVEQLEALLKVEMDPDRARHHRLGLARMHEEAGDARRAEQTLETTRRTSPTDLQTLRALADFYGRQNAQTALAMHLNRAAQDFRHALATDLTDEAAWIGLVEVLTWRGRHDAARAAASAAISMGIVDVEVAKLVDVEGAAPACTDVLRTQEVEDAIAPAALPAVARQALAILGPHIDKALALDPRSYRAEKLPARDPAVAKLLEEAGQWLGVTELELWVAPGSPRLCLPFAAQPAAIVVGREVLSAPESERRFLLARSLFLAKHGLSGVMRAPAQELAAMLASVAQHFDAGYQPIGLDPGMVHEQGRKLAKAAPRKALDDAGPLVFEMVGLPEYDPKQLAMAVSELGDRIGLLATGAVPAAVSALFRLSGEPAGPGDVASRAAALRRAPEALALVQFAISEPHFEARRRSAAAG